MASTGTTATTTVANEFVLGGVYSSNNVTDGGSGNVTYNQTIANTTEWLAVFDEIKNATGAFHGETTWSGAAPTTFHTAGAIATYSGSGGNTGGDNTSLMMRV
jgi:hypothetical protein